MSKFSDLGKSKFINKSVSYSEGKSADSVEKITFSTTREYINILNDLSIKDRLSKSEIIRFALLCFSRMNKQDREQLYEEIYNKKNM